MHWRCGGSNLMGSRMRCYRSSGDVVLMESIRMMLRWDGVAD